MLTISVLSCTALWGCNGSAAYGSPCGRWYRTWGSNPPGPQGQQGRPHRVWRPLVQAPSGEGWGLIPRGLGRLLCTLGNNADNQGVVKSMSKNFNPNIGERLGPAWRALQDTVEDGLPHLWKDLIATMLEASPTLTLSTFTGFLYTARKSGLITWPDVRDTRGRLVTIIEGGVWPTREV